mgnify:CR=1 FL=1
MHALVFIMKHAYLMKARPGVTKGLLSVQSNFARYGLLDNQIVFLQGWFDQTIPNSDIETLSLLRLDGDTYPSTMDGLTLCYDKLSDGGFCIVDGEQSRFYSSFSLSLSSLFSLFSLSLSLFSLFVFSFICMLTLFSSFFFFFFFFFFLFSTNNNSSLFVTDYFSLDGCRRAVDEYRTKHQINDEMIRIDGLSSYWRKGSGPSTN